MHRSFWSSKYKIHLAKVIKIQNTLHCTYPKKFRNHCLVVTKEKQFRMSELVAASFSPSTDWLGGAVVSVLDSRSRGPGFDSRPVHRQATTLRKLLTPMCLCHQAVQFGTGQRAVILCDRQGNRRSGVALAMQHRL